MSFEAFKAICRSQLMQVEVAIVAIYMAELPPSEAFSAIDGGAHTGYHTVRLADIGHCAAVVAIEADPFTVEKLHRNVERQTDAVRAKITVVQKALQEDQDRETVQWMSSSSHPGRSGVSSIWQKDNAVIFRDEMSAEATTIDKLSKDLPAPVRMIKLDLEGGDFMALKGAEETLRRDRPLVVFENSVRAPGIYGFTIADVISYFDSVDYVPVTFAGEIATEETWFQFWEMWAAPKADAERLASRLRAVTAHIVETAGEGV